MIDYSKGKIYMVYCFTTKKKYYGSTVETLSRRLTNHVRAYKCWLKGNSKRICSVIEILKNENYKIILVENYPCKNKEELEKKESEYILNNECVNKNVPRRTQREYYLANREIILKKHKEQVKDEEFKKRKSINDKKYRLKHKEKVLENKKIWSKKRNENYKSWGGSIYTENNSLLKIDVSLFLE